jgi:hypothetical protein
VDTSVESEPEGGPVPQPITIVARSDLAGATPPKD